MEFLVKQFINPMSHFLLAHLDFKQKESRAGKVTQSVKCLSCKCEGLSLVSCTHRQSWVW